MGASVELAGDTYAEAETRCEELRDQRVLTLVHPFDDPLVIAGQGTVATRFCATPKASSIRCSSPWAEEV